MTGSLGVDLDKLQRTLDALQSGDEVEIHFADASKNYNVRKITNPVIACHKRVVGRFVGIFYEKAYGTEYVLLQTWEYSQDVKDSSRVIWCIVVSTLTHVQRIEKKAKKVTSATGQVYLGGGQLKTAENEDGIGELISS